MIIDRYQKMPCALTTRTSKSRNMPDHEMTTTGPDGGVARDLNVIE
jgi:hypothetical protein